MIACIDLAYFEGLLDCEHVNLNSERHFDFKIQMFSINSLQCFGLFSEVYCLRVCKLRFWKTRFITQISQFRNFFDRFCLFSLTFGILSLLILIFNLNKNVWTTFLKEWFCCFDAADSAVAMLGICRVGTSLEFLQPKKIGPQKREHID